MDNTRRVVVVDGLPETEQVLKAVLEPRGFQVSRTRGTNPPSALTASKPPQLLVLHHDQTQNASNGSRDVNWPTTPAVIIGNLEVPATAGNHVPDHCRMLSHPFHYAELINAIDRLLECPPDTNEAAAA